MTRYFFYLGIFIGIVGLTACEIEKESEGQPILTINSEINAAHFGDSISFTAIVSDVEVPLSTLKAQIFFGDEKVSETVIRTKTYGQYSGKIFVPYYQNIPNATATIKFVLQNIRFAIEEESFNLPLTRPDYPYLTLVTETGNYNMPRTGLYQYAATNDFPQKVKGYIKTPVITAQGNEVTFGWVNGSIKEGAMSTIPFSNATAGTYSIMFNTLNYSASPFITLKFAGTEMSLINDDNYKVEINLTKNQTIEVTGIANLNDWWIDDDYIKNNQDGTFTFKPVTGKYRVTANFRRNYFIFEAMSGSNLATLQPDGSGALWIIGTDIGKPSLMNEVGWNPDNALCMAQYEAKKYQVTVVAGESIKSNSINFKFFHQKGWGGEYTHNSLTTTSSLILVGNGTNGRDPGNLGIVSGQTLTPGKKYVFRVDITGGKNNAILSVTEL